MSTKNIKSYIESQAAKLTENESIKESADLRILEADKLIGNLIEAINGEAFHKVDVLRALSESDEELAVEFMAKLNASIKEISSELGVF